MLTNVLTGLCRYWSESAACTKLRRELLTLVHGQQDTANRLLAVEHQRHPEKSERWYLKKVIYDLRRDA
jgi:hypothetical protein